MLLYQFGNIQKGRVKLLKHILIWSFVRVIGVFIGGCGWWGWWVFGGCYKLWKSSLVIKLMKNLPGQIYPVVMTNAAYWQVTVQTREDWVLPTPWVMWCDPHLSWLVARAHSQTVCLPACPADWPLSAGSSSPPPSAPSARPPCQPPARSESECVSNSGQSPSRTFFRIRKVTVTLILPFTCLLVQHEVQVFLCHKFTAPGSKAA